VPRFSVIVPVHQVQAYLPECLDSVLTQSFTDLELILVDDGSPPDCGELLADAAADPRVTVLRLPGPTGPGPARNAGLTYARGDYVLFLDSDDALTTGALQALAARLSWPASAKTSAGIASGASAIPVSTGPSSKRIVSRLSELESARLASPDVRDEFGLETIDMNMGPQHPAMHGLLRLILELDGETVVRCDPIMGYLHRCQEKIAENRMYPAVIPMTDRLDYFANMHNEHGYCLAVEDLLDAEIPPRAEYIRVLMCELMRLASHIPSIGFLLLELGELDRLFARLVAQGAHAMGDGPVLLGDALEELGPLEQVAEPVGLQDHGQGVGAVRLVDLDEAGGQHVARGLELAAQALEAVTRLLELVAHLLQLGLLALEALLGSLEAALGGGDLTLEDLDAVAELLDRRREDALLVARLGDLVALLLDAFLERRRRQSGQRKDEVGRKGQRYWQPEGLPH
jgi:glycosyltransferase involved in cell wall biosynthesis